MLSKKDILAKTFGEHLNILTTCASTLIVICKRKETNIKIQSLWWNCKVGLTGHHCLWLILVSDALLRLALCDRMKGEGSNGCCFCSLV
ncbi:hypothetical protein PRUPE_1G570600 [Prunus persica]|uniref:Uncharacterized protein n=1 Tax=Prunus persica TaxID=3760 RepID=A0A251RJH8_PRUPE|nr:hypothetical protein PRUPE_1G570600 [Prunus persica]